MIYNYILNTQTNSYANNAINHICKSINKTKKARRSDSKKVRCRFETVNVRNFGTEKIYHLDLKRVRNVEFHPIQQCPNNHHHYCSRALPDQYPNYSCSLLALCQFQQLEQKGVPGKWRDLQLTKELKETYAIYHIEEVPAIIVAHAFCSGFIVEKRKDGLIHVVHVPCW